MAIAVPEQPLRSLQFTQQPRPFLLVVVGDAARLLLQRRQAHGDVEPVQDVLGFRGDQRGKRAVRKLCSLTLAAIGQKCHVLVGLQSLTFQQLGQPALRLPVIAMHQANVAGPAVVRHGPADDQLEVGLPVVPVPDVAAIQADDNPPFRDRQSGSLC